MSLDLSNNNLSDILDVVQKLSTLPKMRNLVLQGNPLSVSGDDVFYMRLVMGNCLERFISFWTDFTDDTCICLSKITVNALSKVMILFLHW